MCPRKVLYVCVFFVFIWHFCAFADDEKVWEIAPESGPGYPRQRWKICTPLSQGYKKKQSCKKVGNGYYCKNLGSVYHCGVYCDAYNYFTVSSEMCACSYTCKVGQTPRVGFYKMGVQHFIYKRIKPVPVPDSKS